MRWIERLSIPTINRAMSPMGKRRPLFIGLIVMFCGVELCCTVLYPMGIKGVVNALGSADLALFWRSMGILLISVSLWWLYAPLASYYTARISKDTICAYRTGLLGHILGLPLRFFGGTPKGELLSAFSNDMRCLQGVYDWSFFQVLRSVSGGVGGVIVMAAIDWRFALVVFALGTASVLVSARFSARLEAIGQEQQQRLARSSADAHELVKAAKTIRLFRLQPAKEAQFARSTQAEADTKVQYGRVTAQMNAAVVAINMLSYLAILFAGALFVLYGLSDWGTVIALMGLKGVADMLFVEAGQFLAGMQGNVAGIKRLFALMDAPRESLDTSAFEFRQEGHALSVEGLTFAYDVGVPIVRGFSMALAQNTLTALVGESGCGKSTVMKLILGLYRPDAGKIAFCGAGESTTQAIRAQTAYVPQDAMLFAGSVRENIACGKEGATPDEVMAAARRAGAHEFISAMEDGYDTVLYDEGKNLSGGQRQRIAIARALIKDAPILLLDEVTSALDRDSEAQVLGTIQQISRTRAVLFITHKQDVRQWADSVYVLE